MDTASRDTRIDVGLTRSGRYSLLSKLLQYPGGQIVDDMRGVTVESVQAFLQREDCVTVLESEYNRLFAHLGSAKCPPYETEYGYDNVFQKTQAMADIAGFYRAFGLEVGPRNTDRVDFIGTEMEFMSYLTLHEAYAKEHEEAEHLGVCVQVQQKFMQDHLGRWVFMFSQILLSATDNPMYVWLARSISEFIDEECRILSVSPTKVSAPGMNHASPLEPFECSACVAQYQHDSKPNEVADVNKRGIGDASRTIK